MDISLSSIVSHTLPWVFLLVWSPDKQRRVKTWTSTSCHASLGCALTPVAWCFIWWYSVKHQSIWIKVCEDLVANGMRENNILGQWAGFRLWTFFGEEEVLGTTIVLDFRPQWLGKNNNKTVTCCHTLSMPPAEDIHRTAKGATRQGAESTPYCTCPPRLRHTHTDSENVVGSLSPPKVYGCAFNSALQDAREESR